MTSSDRSQDGCLFWVGASLKAQHLHNYIAFYTSCKTSWASVVDVVPSAPRIHLVTPGMLTQCRCRTSSPVSMFLSLSTMSWETLPSFQVMWLSVAKQLDFSGWIVFITVPSGTSLRSCLAISTKSRMENSASPMPSSLVNVSWSKSSCDVNRSAREEEST